MTMQTMNITLSTVAPDRCWGEKAILSSNDNGFIIHLTDEDVPGTIQRAARKIDNMGIHHVTLSDSAWDVEKCWAFWQGFRSPKAQQQVVWPTLSDSERAQLEERRHIIDWVRDTINQPAQALGPSQLARNAVDLLSAVAGDRMSYRITRGEELREQQYNGIYTVGRGSSRPPALLALDYNPDGDKSAPVFACLVGKGITFDSGGYSLKQGTYMESMKSDMGGAALLTGALALAIAQGLKKRVRLYLCCAENMVSGSACRPGDVIHYRNGKRVEVMNTDAEGRLVLADGLIDACEQQPELLIDAATLTGAAKTALGNDYHAVLTFDDALAQSLMSSAAQEQEPFWRLPLAEFHRHHLSSAFADLSNIASPGHMAGASNAAAFLSWFVKNYRRGWLHLDCSATYRKSATGMWSAGATGIGVRTLARLLLNSADR